MNNETHMKKNCYEQIEEIAEILSYIDNLKGTESCSGIKNENMLEILELGTEEYEKTGAGNDKMNSHGDGCNNEVKYEESHVKRDVLNQQEVETVLSEINIRNDINKSDENYEDIFSANKNENGKSFDFKHFKNVTDLIPLIDNIAICSVIDSNFTTNTKSNSYQKRNHLAPSNLNDFSPRKFPPKHSKIYQDASDDPITIQRCFKITSMYRNACKIFEDLILIPFIMLIAESIDIIIFVFFLLVSTFYTLYSSMNTTFYNFYNNKINFSDLLERENVFNAYDHSTNSLENKICGNFKLEEKDSMSSYLFHAEDTASLANETEIYVVPEKVNVIKHVCEHTKPIQEDSYEKGSNFLKKLCKEHATAVVESHEDALVAIILKESEIPSSGDDRIKIKAENNCPIDLELENIKSPNVIIQSNGNSSWKFITLSDDFENISEDILESTYLSNNAEAEERQSHSKEIPISTIEYPIQANLHEKGSEILKNVFNEHAIAVVESQENMSVDIILKENGIQSNEDDCMNVKAESDSPTNLELENINSSNVIYQSNESNPWKFNTFSNDPINILDDIFKSTYSSNDTEAERNYTMRFPKLFDETRNNIFNSMEIDKPILENRKQRQTLSSSEINIFDSFCSPESTCGNYAQKSSLSINAASSPTLSSSMIFSPSLYSPNLEDKAKSFQEGSSDIDLVGKGQDSNFIRMSDENIGDNSANRTLGDQPTFSMVPKSPGKLFGSPQSGEPYVMEDIEKSNSLVTSKNFPVKVPSTSKCSNAFGHISTINAEEETSFGENSLRSDDLDSISFLDSSEDICDKICPTNSDDATESDIRILKTKRECKLRRRMSGIFNNFKAVNLVQCVIPRMRQKKYKKSINGSDA